MRRGPQLEVVDPVVQAIPISMVDHFIWQKRPAEVKGHHQPVLTDLGDPSNEASKRSGDWHLAIAVA